MHKLLVNRLLKPAQEKVTWCINWRRLLALIIFQRSSLKSFPKRHYKKIGYNINVLQQTACLVVNPITVGSFAFLFNCTPVGRTSDSMMVPTWRHIHWWDGRGLMLWLFVGPTGVYLFDFFCSGIQFFLLLSPYLCFISLLYLDLYVLGDDALISEESFMQTKHLCVLINIWIKGEVGAVKPV